MDITTPEIPTTTHTGSCLCGADTFEVEVEGELPGLDACHGTKCREFSGHVLAGTDIPRSAMTVHGEENVTWYQSSDKVRRGFCPTSGSSLYFDPLFHDWTSVCLWAFDGPTHTKLANHIFVPDGANVGNCVHFFNDGCLDRGRTPKYAEALHLRSFA